MPTVPNGMAPRSAENRGDLMQNNKNRVHGLGLWPLCSFSAQGDHEAAEDQPPKCMSETGAPWKQELATAVLVWEIPCREAGLTDDAERLAGKF